MADILPYLGVERHFSEDDAASREIVLDDFSGMSREETEKILKSQSLSASFVGNGETVTAQIPAAGKTVPGGSQVLIYLGEIPQERMVQVPDFLGMNRAQAVAEAGSQGLYILHCGSNELSSKVVVTSQNIPVGTQVIAGTTIQLEFTDTGARD